MKIIACFICGLCVLSNFCILSLSSVKFLSIKPSILLNSVLVAFLTQPHTFGCGLLALLMQVLDACMYSDQLTYIMTCLSAELFAVLWKMVFHSVLQFEGGLGIIATFIGFTAWARMFTDCLTV